MPPTDPYRIPGTEPPEQTQAAEHSTVSKRGNYALFVSMGALVLSGIAAYSGCQQTRNQEWQARTAHNALELARHAAQEQRADVERARAAAEVSANAALRIAESQAKQLDASTVFFNQSLAESRRSIDSSLQTFRLEQRAWVGATAATPPECEYQGRRTFVAPGCTSKPGMFIENIGRTPARAVRIRSQALRAAPAFTFRVGEELGTPSELSVATLFPGQKRGSAVQAVWTGESIIEGLLQGNQRIFLFGRIDYLDVFSRPHFTTYCVYLTSDLSSLNNCAFGNEDDAN